MRTPQHTFITTWDIDIDNYSPQTFIAQFSPLHEKTMEVDFRHSLLHPASKPPEGLSFGVSLNQWQNVHKGDRFFCYLISKDKRIENRIIGSGFFTSEPCFDGQWKSEQNVAAYTAYVEFDVILHPFHHLELLMQPALELQFPDYDWSEKLTDTMLDNHTAYLLEQKWYHYLVSESPKLPKSDFWCRSRDGIESMYSWRDEQGNLDYGQAMLYMKYLRTQHKFELNNYE